MWVLCVYSVCTLCTLCVYSMCVLYVLYVLYVCTYTKMHLYRSIQIYYEYMWTAIILVCTFTRCICIERERERERNGDGDTHISGPRNTLQHSATHCTTLQRWGDARRGSLSIEVILSQSVCTVLQHIAACCSVLQRVAMCCNVLYSDAKKK